MMKEDLFKDKLILAPLAGVNDIAFRILCRRHGADIVYTWMVNSTALVRGNKATERLIMTSEEERPVVIQLFGYDEKTIKEAAKIVEKNCDMIDINMGCPDADVIRQGAGAALLRRPSKVQRIVEEVKRSIMIPLTVKIRIGFEKPDIEGTLRLAQIIEKAGADAIIVHPRTVRQGYSGKSDWDMIRRVKETVKIPVIGNGDVRTVSDYNALKPMCDSVMIGRGAMSNPDIFNEIKEGKGTIPSQDIKRRVLKEYISILKDKGLVGTVNLRQRCQMLLSGYKGSTSVRAGISRMSDEEILSSYG